MKPSNKKILSAVATVFTILILLFAVGIMIFTIISVRTVGKHQAEIFGHRAFIVLSDSMKDTFKAGDMIVVKVEDDVENLPEGTVITFRSADPDSYGEIVTHKIRQKIEVNGKTAYVTYGTTTGVDDATPVLAENIIGIYRFRLAGAGYFFQFLKTPWGYVVIVLIPFLLLIGVNFVRFLQAYRQYKGEKEAKTRALEAAAEADRAETMRLRQELEALKARMNGTPSDSFGDAEDATGVDGKSTDEDGKSKE